MKQIHSLSLCIYIYYIYIYYICYNIYIINIYMCVHMFDTTFRLRFDKNFSPHLHCICSTSANKYWPLWLVAWLPFLGDK